MSKRDKEDDTKTEYDTVADYQKYIGNAAMAQTGSRRSVIRENVQKLLAKRKRQRGE